MVALTVAFRYQALKNHEDQKMIVCCGEALIDMVPVLDDAGATTYAPLSGGAIFNTAIALGRLQASVGLVSGVSTDLFLSLIHI